MQKTSSTNTTVPLRVSKKKERDVRLARGLAENCNTGILTQELLLISRRHTQDLAKLS